MTQRTPIDMNIDTQGVLLPREAPEQIIGFSKYYTGTKFCFRTSHHEVSQFCSIVKQVKEVIAYHQPTIKDNKDNFNPFPDSATLLEALIAESEKRLNFDKDDKDPPHPSKIPTCINGSPYTGSKVFSLSKPTLFIFTTDFPIIKFVSPCIQKKFPSPKIFPWCNDIRLWNDGTVMGWYSSFRAGDDPKVDLDLGPQTFWFDLVIQAHKLDASGQVVPNSQTLLSSLMDPGLDPP